MIRDTNDKTIDYEFQKSYSMVWFKFQLFPKIKIKYHRSYCRRYYNSHLKILLVLYKRIELYWTAQLFLENNEESNKENMAVISVPVNLLHVATVGSFKLHFFFPFLPITKSLVRSLYGLMSPNDVTARVPKSLLISSTNGRGGKRRAWNLLSLK